MLLEKEKQLEFYDGQYQFKVPFMLYVDFESMLKPGNEKYRVKLDQRKDQKSYTEKISSVLCSYLAHFSAQAQK